MLGGGDEKHEHLYLTTQAKTELLSPWVATSIILVCLNK